MSQKENGRCCGNCGACAPGPDGLCKPCQIERDKAEDPGPPMRVRDAGLRKLVHAHGAGSGIP